MGKTIKVRSHVRKGKKVVPHVRIIKAKTPAKKYVRTPIGKNNAPESEEAYKKRIAENAKKKPLLSKDRQAVKTFAGKTPEQIAALRDKAIQAGQKIKKNKMKRELSLARRTQEKKAALSSHVKTMQKLASKKSALQKKQSYSAGSLNTTQRKSVLAPTKLPKAAKIKKVKGTRVSDRLSRASAAYNRGKYYAERTLHVGL